MSPTPDHIPKPESPVFRVELDVEVRAPRTAAGWVAMRLWSLAVRLGLETEVVPATTTVRRFEELSTEEQDGMVIDILTDPSLTQELDRDEE